MSATSRIISMERNAKGNTALAPEALAALHKAGFSRRAFLRGTGALIVTFTISRPVETAFGQGRGRGAVDPTIPDPNQVDSWLAIGTDGSVTAYTGKVELGQGISTAQIQLIAEELSVP